MYWPEDIAARIGGDEFLIFLEYNEPIEAVIERIFTGLPRTYEDFSFSISMGIALCPEVGNSYIELFCAADEALYTAKRGGTGTYCFSSKP